MSDDFFEQLEQQSLPRKLRIELLRAEIEQANIAYYQKSQPIMSDETYDAKFRELVELENADV